MTRRKQKTIAALSAVAAMAFVGGFVGADLYLWPQLRWPVAVIGASFFGLLALAGIGALVFHWVYQTDAKMEAKGAADRQFWRDALKAATKHQ